MTENPSLIYIIWTSLVNWRMQYQEWNLEIMRWPNTSHVLRQRAVSDGGWRVSSIQLCRHGPNEPYWWGRGRVPPGRLADPPWRRPHPQRSQKMCTKTNQQENQEAIEVKHRSKANEQTLLKWTDMKSTGQARLGSSIMKKEKEGHQYSLHILWLYMYILITCNDINNYNIL